MNRRLKAMRALRGLRQVDLSQQTGISQSKISLIEGGLTRMRQSEKESIASALGENSEALFPGG